MSRVASLARPLQADAAHDAGTAHRRGARPRKLLRFFPAGFADESYVEWERG